MASLIKVGITPGDYNGVGYEVVLKTLATEGITDLFIPLVFGNLNVAHQCINDLGIQGLNLHVINDPSKAKTGKINFIPVSDAKVIIKPGEISKEAGREALRSLDAATAALQEGEVDVIVTAPICKEAIQNESFNFPGHTEYLEYKVGEGNKALMILFNDTLRVALLTIHLPLAKVPENVTIENIIETTELFSSVLKKDFGCEKPIIAILSLNPHAGDGGVLGREEQEVIIPAIKTLQHNGILAYGPYAADGFFGHGTYKRFDGILAMYHDQGLAPFKTIASTGGVNFTAGLPFVRTSPDHGTAFDIAWQGKADETAFRDAIYKAIDIYRKRKIFEEMSSNPLKKYYDKHDKFENSDKSVRKPSLEKEND